MNTTHKITSVLTPILLTGVLVGCGHAAATATTIPASKAPASAKNLSTFDPIPSTIPASTPVIVAQATREPRYLGALQFPFGATFASADNFVEGNRIDRYTFAAAAGQSARINISSQTGQVLLTLIAPDGTPIARSRSRVPEASQSGGTSWSGTLPMNGTYRIDAVNQYIGSRYTVNVSIQPAGNNSTQIHNRGSIEFPSGGTFASIDGYLAPQNIDRYRFRASAGQPVNVYVGSPNAQVLLTLIDPNGNPIVRYQSGANSWAGRLPADGVYQVDVANQSGASFYNLGLSIR